MTTTLYHATSALLCIIPKVEGDLHNPHQTIRRPRDRIFSPVNCDCFKSPGQERALGFQAPGNEGEHASTPAQHDEDVSPSPSKRQDPSGVASTSEASGESVVP